MDDLTMGEAVSDLLAATGVLGVLAAAVIGAAACCCWVTRRLWPLRPEPPRAVDDDDPPSPMTPPPLVVLKDTRGGIALVDHPDGGNALGLRQPGAKPKPARWA